MTPKPHSERVNGEIARFAIAEARQRTHIWTHYILRHFEITRDLAPGCDYKDLVAWLQANMPEEWAATARHYKSDTKHAQAS